MINTFHARQIFTQLAALDESIFPLDRAALAIALEEHARMNMEFYLQRLDTLAASVEILLGENRSPANVIESLNEVLFAQEGLRGNTEDYYDPANSFLNEVLDRKLGIPISLSIIYIEVARRIDFPLDGVGFPGHFLARHVGSGQEIIIDPFNQGKILTRKDCQELLDRIYGGTVQMKRAHLQPMEKKAIVSRMLFNLKGIYYQKEEYYRALATVERILLLNPGVPSEIRDRGLLYMQTSLFSKALADLEFYLAKTNADDRNSIQRHIKTLRGVVTATN